MVSLSAECEILAELTDFMNADAMLRSRFQVAVRSARSATCLASLALKDNR